jgi:hypothetical protein
MQKIQFKAMVLVPIDELGQSDDGIPKVRYEEMLITIAVDDTTFIESNYSIPKEGDPHPGDPIWGESGR